MPTKQRPRSPVRRGWSRWGRPAAPRPARGPWRDRTLGVARAGQV